MVLPVLQQEPLHVFADLVRKVEVEEAPRRGRRSPRAALPRLHGFFVALERAGCFLEPRGARLTQAERLHAPGLPVVDDVGRRR